MTQSLAYFRPMRKSWPMPSNETKSESTKFEEVPKNAASDLEPRQEDQRSNSVFDFLYHDSRRIASFLAQFETYGVLQQVKATESISRTGGSKTTASAGVDVVTVMRGGITIDGTVVDEERDAAERTYDPLWTNARTFLSFLADREMINRDLSTARIGQFVLASGALAAFDLGLLKEAWKLPAVKDVVLKGATGQAAPDPVQGNRKERAKARYAQKAAGDTSETAMAFEMLKIMPHTVQATIRGEDWTVWSSLREDSLVIPGSELLLKHGVAVAGSWSMLGVLDALPHEGDASTQAYILDQLLAAVSLGAIGGQVVGQLAPSVRLLLGRPASAFGMTPLLIFREVSG
jgi:hypothetical protein